MSSRPAIPYHVNTIGGVGVANTDASLSETNIGNTVEVIRQDLRVFTGVLIKKTDEIYRVAVKNGFPWYNIETVTIDRTDVVKITKIGR